MTKGPGQCMWTDVQGNMRSVQLGMGCDAKCYWTGSGEREKVKKVQGFHSSGSSTAGDISMNIIDRTYQVQDVEFPGNYLACKIPA